MTALASKTPVKKGAKPEHDYLVADLSLDKAILAEAAKVNF